MKSIPDSVGIFTETLRSLKKAKLNSGDLSRIKFQWAENILSRLKVELKIQGKASELNPLLFVGNHISYLDIPILMKAARDSSFVAKQELSAWPVFGAAARHLDTVFVKRDSAVSRTLARQGIHDALAEGKRIIIFPSGTTALEEKKTWKKGAFEIAYEKNVMIQPFRITYKPLRAVAYIDEDIFPLHLNSLFSFEKIEAEVEFHPPVKVLDPLNDCLYWQYWSRGLMQSPVSLHNAVDFLTPSSQSSNTAPAQNA